MKRQRNKFLSLIFSCMPGAGQMYMGFMNRGLILMSAFFGAMFLSSIFFGELLFILPIIWFYAFFDSINLAWADSESFEKEPDTVQMMEKAVGKNPLSKYKKGVGVALILLGVYVLFEKIHWILNDLAYKYLGENFFYLADSIPRMFISVIIIIIGIKLILHKKKEMGENE